MNNLLIDDLNHTIEQKLELFSEIYNITVLQQKDIEDNQADNIEALVQQKQLIIDKIDKLDESFLEGYKQLKLELQLDSLEKADINKYPELKSIRSSVDKIMGLAQKIMELENSNREKLDAIFQAIKCELRKVNTGKRSIRAYEAVPVYNDGIYIDKKK